MLIPLRRRRCRPHHHHHHYRRRRHRSALVAVIIAQFKKLLNTDAGYGNTEFRLPRGNPQTLTVNKILGSGFILFSAFCDRLELAFGIVEI